MEAAAFPVDSSYISHTPSLSSSSTSDKPTWRAIHKLEFGAKPEKRNRREWICGLECKKNKEVVTFKDAQAAEKHIMREHPDPIYNKFVCLKDGCGKEKVSPQQILDHLGQRKEKRGHNITVKIEKDENLRAVKKSTGEKFRYAEKVMHMLILCSGFFGTRIPLPGTSVFRTSHPQLCSSRIVPAQ